jgi:hypothetical protein
MTINGRKDAKDLVIGEVLVAMDIDDTVTDWLNWSAENIELHESNIVTTEVVSITPRQIDELYLINGDLYSGSHYILTEKDGLNRFIRVDEIDNSYKVFSYSELSFIPIEILEVIEYEDTVYSINCEPYDNFFTENMLVFDSRDPI